MKLGPSMVEGAYSPNTQKTEIMGVLWVWDKQDRGSKRKEIKSLLFMESAEENG